MTERVARVVQGQRLSAGRDNRLAETVESISDNQALIAQAVIAAAREIIEQSVIAGQLFIITDVSGTELVAKPGVSTPAGGETTVTIYLPDDLTATTWPGSITVTHTDVNNANTSSETWLMTKAYAVGDVIEAFVHDDGRWMDRNIAGRMWAWDPDA